MKTYKVIKRINNNPYLYLQSTKREGKRVKTVFCKCLGRANGSDIYNYSNKFFAHDFPTFKGFRDETFDCFKSLTGKSLVSRQLITDLVKQSSVKPHIKAMTESVLDDFPKEKVPVVLFFDELKAFLLGLNDRILDYPHHEGTTLPDEYRGYVEYYDERVYLSGVPNGAGYIHFSSEKIEDYFAHTRFENMEDDTRRILEIQSDFFQRKDFREKLKKDVPEKVNTLLSLIPFANTDDNHFFISTALTLLDNYLSFYPLRNDWYKRIISEEINKARDDKADYIQFPTGKTALLIEELINLGEAPTDAKEGDTIEIYGEDYVVVKDYWDSVEVVYQADIMNSFDYLYVREDEWSYIFDEISNNPENYEYELENIANMSREEYDYLTENGIDDFQEKYSDLLESYIYKIIDDRYKDAHSYAEYHKMNFGERCVVSENETIQIIKESAEVYHYNKENTLNAIDRDDLDDSKKKIYDFYEEDIGKYLKKTNKTTQRITDDRSIEWYQVDLRNEAIRDKDI